MGLPLRVVLIWLVLIGELHASINSPHFGLGVLDVVYDAPAHSYHQQPQVPQHQLQPQGPGNLSSHQTSKFSPVFTQFHAFSPGSPGPDFEQESQATLYQTKLQSHVPQYQPELEVPRNRAKRSFKKPGQSAKSKRRAVRKKFVRKVNVCRRRPKCLHNCWLRPKCIAECLRYPKCLPRCVHKCKRRSKCRDKPKCLPKCLVRCRHRPNCLVGCMRWPKCQPRCRRYKHRH